MISTFVWQQLHKAGPASSPTASIVAGLEPTTSVLLVHAPRSLGPSWGGPLTSYGSALVVPLILASTSKARRARKLQEQQQHMKV